MKKSCYEISVLTNLLMLELEQDGRWCVKAREYCVYCIKYDGSFVVVTCIPEGGCRFIGYAVRSDSQCSRDAVRR